MQTNFFRVEASTSPPTELADGLTKPFALALARGFNAAERLTPLGIRARVVAATATAAGHREKSPVGVAGKGTDPVASQQRTLTPGVVRADEAYTLEELKARLRIGEHAWWNLRNAGLRTARIGKGPKILGAHVLEVLGRLAEAKVSRRRCGRSEE